MTRFVQRLVLTSGLTLAAFFVLAFAASSFAQMPPAAPQQGTHVHDTTALHPPPGANVAIVEFDDMQCPQCGRVNPTLKAAAAQYHIPWIRHDFPLAMHNWSMYAAVDARWFDTKSKALGDEYRDLVFANQASIYNPESLREFTEKFAKGHSLTLPFSVDPQGTLSALVKADQQLGERTGIEHTPTIWIVAANTDGPKAREVIDINKLYEAIDDALHDVKVAAANSKKKYTYTFKPN